MTTKTLGGVSKRGPPDVIRERKITPKPQFWGQFFGFGVYSLRGTPFHWSTIGFNLKRNKDKMIIYYIYNLFSSDENESHSCSWGKENIVTLYFDIQLFFCGPLKIERTWTLCCRSCKDIPDPQCAFRCALLCDFSFWLWNHIWHKRSCHHYVVQPLIQFLPLLEGQSRAFVLALVVFQILALVVLQILSLVVLQIGLHCTSNFVLHPCLFVYDEQYLSCVACYQNMSLHLLLSPTPQLLWSFHSVPSTQVRQLGQENFLVGPGRYLSRLGRWSPQQLQGHMTLHLSRRSGAGGLGELSKDFWRMDCKPRESLYELWCSDPHRPGWHQWNHCHFLVLQKMPVCDLGNHATWDTVS